MNYSTSRTLFEWLGFQFVWMISAIAAARDLAWPGAASALLFTAVALATGDRSRATIVPVLASAAIGAVAETALIASGAIRYAAAWPSPAVAPLWIVTLWLAFGVTLAPLARWLGGQPWIVHALVGAMTGPLAYFAGVRLGAIDVVASPANAYLAIALVWAVVLPILLRLARA
jgi:hypothetical protein